MGQRSAIRIGVALVAASLAFAAAGCGNRGGETGSQGGDGGDAPTKTAKIGVISPTSGGLSALGIGIKNSVDLAIKQANETKAIPGWTLELAAEDDAENPDTGKNAATKLAADDEVVGVVGTLQSSIAQQVQPVLAAANIVQVSPANTNDTLTKGANFETAPERPYPTYFRVCAVDSLQGPYAAQYVYNTLKFTKVATIHDKLTYGQGLVEAFTKEYTKLGGTIVAAETVQKDETDFGAVISKIAPKAPQLVYYGGQYPQSGPLSNQMKSGGLKVPVMGGDGMQAGDYIKLAGAASEGDFATSVGAPTDALESAKKYVDDYGKAGYKDPYETYGGYSYDAANSIIEALKVALKDATDAKSARPKVVEAMANVSFDGVTGKVGFDEFGDTTTKILTMYKVESGKWAAASTDDLGQ